VEALLDLCCVALANLDSNAHLFQMLDAARSSSYCSSARPLQSGKAKGNPVKWGGSAQKYSGDKYQSKSVKAQMGLAWFLAHHKILCRSRLMFEIFNPTQMGKFYSLSIVLVDLAALLRRHELLVKVEVPFLPNHQKFSELILGSGFCQSICQLLV
jgi:hypothetical protein